MGGWLSCNRIDLPPNATECLKHKKDISDPNAKGAQIAQIKGDLKLTCYPK